LLGLSFELSGSVKPPPTRRPEEFGRFARSETEQKVVELSGSKLDRPASKKIAAPGPFAGRRAMTA
jgi:hypothetical protein